MPSNQDAIETALIYQPDVAAGIVNAYYARGTELIKSEYLFDAPLAGSYESKEAMRKLTRDVAKFCVRNGICEVVFAFEIQSYVDPDISIRVFGYDGVAYRDQLDNPTLRALYKLGVSRVAPIFTLVLYFGAEVWNRRRKLSERATMSADFARALRPHFNDLEVPIVDFAGMNDEELALYPNDVRIIAEYFRCKRNGEEFEPSRIKIVRFKELVQFMRYVVGDERFAYDLITDGYEKEPEYMCEILDRIENRGFQKGEASGFKNGEASGFKKGEASGFQKGEASGFKKGEASGFKNGELQEKRRSALKLLNEKHWTVEEIAKFHEVDVVDVKIWINEAEEEFKEK